MTMRRMAIPAGFVLVGFMAAGCATATIEDAVPAGALAQSFAETPSSDPGAEQMAVTHERASATSAERPIERSAGVYPNLNVPPAAAAPQISAQKKAADRADLRARQQQLVAAGREAGVSEPASALSGRAGDLASQGDDLAVRNDAEALSRLAATHGAEVLKEIEGK